MWGNAARRAGRSALAESSNVLTRHKLASNKKPDYAIIDVGGLLHLRVFTVLTMWSVLYTVGEVNFR